VRAEPYEDVGVQPAEGVSKPVKVVETAPDGPLQRKRSDLVGDVVAGENPALHQLMARILTRHFLTCE
jgi:hypothetical protein